MIATKTGWLRERRRRLSVERTALRVSPGNEGGRQLLLPDMILYLPAIRIRA